MIHICMRHTYLTTKSKMNVCSKQSSCSGEVYLRGEGQLEWRWFHSMNSTKSYSRNREGPQSSPVCFLTMETVAVTSHSCLCAFPSMVTMQPLKLWAFYQDVKSTPLRPHMPVNQQSECCEETSLVTAFYTFNKIFLIIHRTRKQS